MFVDRSENWHAPSSVTHGRFGTGLDLVDQLGCQSNYSTFLTLLMTAGFEHALRDASEFTVFVMPNAVFADPAGHAPNLHNTTSDEAADIVAPFVVEGRWWLRNQSSRQVLVSDVFGELRVLRLGDRPTYCGTELTRKNMAAKGVVYHELAQNPFLQQLNQLPLAA